MTSQMSFLDLYYSLNKCIWNRVILHHSRDCDGIERQLHILAKHLNVQNASLNHHEKRVVQYALVDAHPDVVSLKKYLGNNSNYMVDDQVDTDKMTTDFLLLMALRDRFSKKSGFQSYATMIMSLEEMELSGVKNILTSRLETQIDRAKTLIEKHGLHLNKWYTGLRSIECSKKVNHIKLLDQFMYYFPVATEHMTIERHVSNRAGFAKEFEPNKVHINVENVNTMFDVCVFFHQLGHGLAHALDCSKGIGRVYSNFYEELTGVLAERFLGKLLDEKSSQCLEDIRCLQYVRFNIEALFELDLWFSKTSPEDLFRAHYEKIIGNLDDAPLSAIQAFRLSEPLYMYNYVLADRVAEKIIESGPSNTSDLASYLEDQVFKHGQNSKWVRMALE